MKGKEMNEVEKRYKSKGTITKKVTVPILVWEEWEADCKENFNNTYFLKMLYDHRFRKDMNEFTHNLLYEMNALSDELFELKSKFAEHMAQPQPKEKQKGEKTFGGNE